MQTTSKDEFWTNVESYPDRLRASEILRVFTSSTTTNDIEEIKRFFEVITLVAIDGAATINGCSNGFGSIADWYLEMHNAMLEYYEGDYLKLLDDPTPIEDADLTATFSQILQRYQAERKCHFSDDFFVCYCDEHDNN